MGKRPGLIDNNENHYGPLGYSGVIRPGGWRELILRKKKHCYTQVNNLVQLVSKKMYYTNIKLLKCCLPLFYGSHCKSGRVEMWKSGIVI